MFCNHCGADLRSDMLNEVKFCYKCGESFEKKKLKLNKLLSYDEFLLARKHKTVERSSHFKGKKRKAVEQRDVKVY